MQDMTGDAVPRTLDDVADSLLDAFAVLGVMIEQNTAWNVEIDAPPRRRLDGSRDGARLTGAQWARPRRARIGSAAGQTLQASG